MSIEVTREDVTCTMYARVSVYALYHVVMRIGGEVRHN